MHGDLCKHLGIDSSTDHPDRYSNLFPNAYINRHVDAEYLKMILFYELATDCASGPGPHHHKIFAFYTGFYE